MSYELKWGVDPRYSLETGVDRGVLYPSDGHGVAWNGIISVDENTNAIAPTPIYYDGKKVNDQQTPREYAGVLTAYTYPDEFLPHDGYVESSKGVYLAEQVPEPFGLSYRTRVGTGNDYKLHILYNLSATPSSQLRTTLSNTTTPTQFVWKLVGVPESTPGFRPTCHVVLDSRELDRDALDLVEAILYGSEIRPPRLLPINDVLGL